jgi:DMSO/TMAO reductase YedYZ molybdopterin-dependent catalytic subunit
MWTRRELLARSLTLAAAGLGAGARAKQDARPVALTPFAEGPPPPLDRLLGAGIDARLFTDLSTLTSADLTIPNDRFYVRTACPEAARQVVSWRITVVDGAREDAIALDSLKPLIHPQGDCLLECSGNTDPSNFGMIGSASWHGVRLATVLERAGVRQRRAWVLVGGVDDMNVRSQTSVPGASWIFPLEALEAAGAFLATQMNGEPLPADHGGPVRLVVPGWYGCACIKWVDRIEIVPGDAAATSQMREFARRTHQQGVPALAREFVPATIDHAAMPVRIEHWRGERDRFYRIVGLLWGGARPTRALAIRLGQDALPVPVDNCPLPASTRTWTLWTHDWRPRRPGEYRIALTLADPSVRSRRLDAAFYARTAIIDTVS